MSADVDPEEAAAVLDGVADASADAAEVAARDFRRPQRCSPSQRLMLAEALSQPASRIPSEIEESSGVQLSLSIGSISEVSAEGLFEDVEGPVLLLCFRVDGQPGWLRWMASEAAALAETMLGGDASAAEARALTRLEQRLIGTPLVHMVATLAQALGLEATDFAFARSVTDAGSWRDAGENADAYRLAVELDLARAGAEATAAQLYLPLPFGPEEAPAAAEALPAHLLPVEVEVRCELAQTRISLAQLLQLEEGDVIPTEALIDDPATLFLEDEPLALAHLGTHRGRLAVRIASTDAGEPTQ